MNHELNKPSFYILKPEEHTVPEDMKKFVETFEPIYFLPESKDKVDNLYYLRVSQSQRWIEDEMEELLWTESHNWKSSDVIHILAWKMGRIDHSKCKTKGIYEFTGNDERQKPKKVSWSDGTKHNFLKANNRSGNIDHISEFVNNILNLRESYKEKNCNNINKRELLKALQNTININGESKVTGIGTVYLITILSFISGGKYPIYDQFAAMAAKAILEGKKPGSRISIDDLPDKNSNAFIDMLDDAESPYFQYIQNIETLSAMYYDGDKSRYQKDRHLDRALWVYGHLFG